MAALPVTMPLATALTDFNRDILKSANNMSTTKYVKRLLSSLQSISKKSSTNQVYCADTELQESVTKCLDKLRQIVLFENSFPETSVLSGLAIALLLNLYICESEKSLHLFLKLFKRQSIFTFELNSFQVDCDLSHALETCLEINDLTKVSALSAILSCSHFVDHIIHFKPHLFSRIHEHIMKVCSHRLIHQFHVFKLIQYWFRAFNSHVDALAQKAPKLLSDKVIVNQTLDQIDNNWEHPLNGVKDCIRTIYNLLLNTFVAFRASLRSNSNLPLCLNYDLIAEEVIRTSNLSFTCKAKYRKYSSLVAFTDWQSVLKSDPNLSSQMLKYLSINSLSTSIIDSYKAIILSMKRTNSNDLLETWSQYFLEPICFILKAKNKVIHNNLCAHILPSTLTIVDDSTQLILANVKDCPIAEVTLVRTAVSLNLAKDLLPPHSWLVLILTCSEDIVREEGLSLLIDERYETDRSKVFELFCLFLSSNLNIDNPSFRQKMVSKIEKFLVKIVISLSDKFKLYGKYDENDTKSAQFLKLFTEIITSNLVSGASFQRRMTCLLLFDTFLNILSRHNLNFTQNLKLNHIYHLILFSIVDKDDKVRKTSTDLLIKFHKMFFDSLEIDSKLIFEISVLFLNSPRHQESHCGSLIMKYIFESFVKLDVNDEELANRWQVFQFMINSMEKQLRSAKADIISSSKHFPIHGWTLAISNCLSNSFLVEVIDEKAMTATINHSIELCFDCIDLMLGQLSHSSLDSSPSFQEMCESLEEVIGRQSSETNDFDDISMSSDFQFLMSFCWLNIKECSFLLAKWVSICQQSDRQLISISTLHKIGSQLISILHKCRHKGVIEATCIALTDYTMALIASNTSKTPLMSVLRQLLSDCLLCITNSTYSSSVTRRSAGIALTIQAILTGEAEALSSGFKLEQSLFDTAIERLIETADSPLPSTVDLTNDLPQTHAMHILYSMVRTASLSMFIVNSMERLLAVCIKGFSCSIWQIRNASLQLFGSCCCRMLGQRKTTDIDPLMPENSTITHNELFSRYPTLLSLFKNQLEQSSSRLESGHLCPELVPILSLFASFSPIGLGQPFDDITVIEHLIRLLSNKIWKIRILSAKALSSLLPICQLQPLLLHMSSRQDLTCNSIHGLIASVDHLLAMKQLNKDQDLLTIKEQFKSFHQILIDSNNKCHILKDVFHEVYNEQSSFSENYVLEFEKKLKSKSIPLKTNNLKEFLTEIHSKVGFDRSDDIRLSAAQTLQSNVEMVLNETHSSTSDQLFELIDIVLVILEDESRDIRSKAELITSKIIKNTLRNSFGSLNFNVAIDCLLMSCVLNENISSEDLSSYLFDKLKSKLSLSDMFEKKVQFNEVLFEREDKNVFAQPLMMMSKMAQCLHQMITIRTFVIKDKEWKKLAEECRLCLQYSSSLQTKLLVSFSIWKLPKMLMALNSVFLRAELFMRLFDCSQQLNVLSLDKLASNSVKHGIAFEDIDVIFKTYEYLSSNFNFLLFIRQKSLCGYTLFDYRAIN